MSYTIFKYLQFQLPVSTNYINLADALPKESGDDVYMNLADINPELRQVPPPPPPPQRPVPKRPSCEPSDVAVRSPPRSRRHNQNFNYAGYMKFAKVQEKSTDKPSPKKAPPPPVAFSPVSKVALSPNAPSPSVNSKKLRRPEKNHLLPKSKEKDESSNEESSGRGKSPIKAKSPSASDPEGEQEVEKKTSSTLVILIRLLLYITSTIFIILFIFWSLTALTSLHFMDIEFIEAKFIES